LKSILKAESSLAFFNNKQIIRKIVVPVLSLIFDVFEKSFNKNPSAYSRSFLPALRQFPTAKTVDKIFLKSSPCKRKLKALISLSSDV